MKQISRRDFLADAARYSVLLGGSSFITPCRRLLAANPEPHFFLGLVYVHGIDPTYFFDARPHQFTDRGLVQNYLYKGPNAVAGAPEPIRYQGKNGQTTLRTNLTDPLMPYKDYFSIVNGVRMSEQFDGHDNNFSLLLSNSPAGMAASFAPIVGNALSQKNQSNTPLESVQLNSFAGNPSNFSRSVLLPSQNINELVSLLSSSDFDPNKSAFSKFLQGRVIANRNSDIFGQGVGRLADGAINYMAPMVDRFRVVKSKAPNNPSRSNNNRQIGPGTPSDIDAELPGLIDSLLNFYRYGVCSSAIIVVDGGSQVFDAHAPQTAQNLPDNYARVASQWTQVIKKLHDSYVGEGSGQKFAEVTTLMIASEFSRTFRQKDKPIDQTGTDHNPISNSIILAGKGIKGGLVVGATDLQQLDPSGRNFEDVSELHRAKDPDLLKAFGMPYDFANGRVNSYYPDYNADDTLLTSANIVNTLYQISGVPKDRWFSKVPGRDSGAAAVINELVDPRHG